jgi:hypothetical protein
MSNDPNTSENAALENPVDGPCDVGKRGWYEVEICDGNVAEEKAEGKVINNIGQ